MAECQAERYRGLAVLVRSYGGCPFRATYLTTNEAREALARD
jgi:hypothetical protein